MGINLKLDNFACNYEGGAGVVLLQTVNPPVTREAKFRSVSFTNNKADLWSNGIGPGKKNTGVLAAGSGWTIDFVDCHFEGNTGSGSDWVSDVKFFSKPIKVSSSC